MSLKRTFGNRKVPLFLMILTILLTFLVPTILAQPVNPSKEGQSDMPAGADLALDFDAYFTVVNYNEPSSPWVLINYYLDNGSSIRMVFGVDNSVYPSLNLNYQNNFIQVFDKKGKVCGMGFQSRSRSNLFVFVPV
jgi:hypothetical protein